jgi:hypothetical protein
MPYANPCAGIFQYGKTDDKKIAYDYYGILYYCSGVHHYRTCSVTRIFGSGSVSEQLYWLHEHLNIRNYSHRFSTVFNIFPEFMPKTPERNPQ